MPSTNKNKGCYYCKHVNIAGPNGLDNPICAPGPEEWNFLKGMVRRDFVCLKLNKEGTCKYFEDRGDSIVNDLKL